MLPVGLSRCYGCILTQTCLSLRNYTSMIIVTDLLNVPFLLPACTVVYCNPRVPMEVQFRNTRRVFDDV